MGDDSAETQNITASLKYIHPCASLIHVESDAPHTHSGACMHAEVAVSGLRP